MDQEYFKEFVEETKHRINNLPWIHVGKECGWTQGRVLRDIVRSMCVCPHKAWTKLTDDVDGTFKHIKWEYYSQICDYERNLKEVRRYYFFGGNIPDFTFAKLVLPQELIDEIRTVGASIIIHPSNQ